MIDTELDTDIDRLAGPPAWQTEIEAMTDDDLLAQINASDPYDVEFARRFRAMQRALCVERKARALDAEKMAALERINLGLLKNLLDAGARAERAEAALTRIGTSELEACLRTIAPDGAPS